MTFTSINRIRSVNVTALNKAFGSTDLYLLDAILKGHFGKLTSILDVGCGEGRNLPYFLSNNFDVSGIDKNPSAIRLCNMMARNYQPDSAKYSFIEGDIRTLPYQQESFDAVISSAVMHFANNEEDFRRMFGESIRVLKNQGIFFIRMASDFVHLTKNSENNFTFLLSKNLLNQILNESGLEKIEPIKSVLVEEQRLMTTLLLRKNEK